MSIDLLPFLHKIQAMFPDNIFVRSISGFGWNCTVVWLWWFLFVRTMLVIVIIWRRCFHWRWEWYWIVWEQTCQFWGEVPDIKIVKRHNSPDLFSQIVLSHKLIKYICINRLVMFFLKKTTIRNCLHSSREFKIWRRFIIWRKQSEHHLISCQPIRLEKGLDWPQSI